MLLWLMNLGFAGGTAPVVVTTSTPWYRTTLVEPENRTLLVKPEARNKL